MVLKHNVYVANAWLIDKLRYYVINLIYIEQQIVFDADITGAFIGNYLPEPQRVRVIYW